MPADPERSVRGWYDPLAVIRSLSIRPHLYIAAAAALVGYFALSFIDTPAVRAVIAWNIGGAVYLLLTARMMALCDTKRIRERAAIEDDGAIAILVIVLLAIAASFLAISIILLDLKDRPGDKVELLGVAGMTILMSWTVTQFVFAVHYAHEFYAPPAKNGDARHGLDFPTDEHPDYWDFLYFAVAIGATCATSDTDVRSKTFRRIITLHMIVAFIFNTMVLAMSINIAASLVG